MASKYDHLSKDELISVLLRRDATQKLGLVWERDEIEHEKSLNDDFVTLSLDESLSIGLSPFENVLIEGDNFDALRFLHIAYKGRVKCVYIDPPYNTGNKDFIYNDSFVDKDDNWRHSKWLEFMYRRLVLVKDLLSEDGVVFVSIGEDEYAHLSLLMDQVFPQMKVGTFVWRRRSGANDEKEWFISADHEYVVCYANPGFSFAGSIKNLSGYTNPDKDPRGPWNNDNLVQGKNLKQRPDAFYPIQNPATGVWYPADPDNTWRFATKSRIEGKKIRTKTMEEIIVEKRILWPDDSNAACYETLEALIKGIEDGSAPHNLRMYLELDELICQVESGRAPEKLLNNILPVEFWVGKKIGYGKPRYKRFLSDLKRTEKPISTWILPSSIKKDDLQSIDLTEVTTFMVGTNSEGTTLLSQMVGNKDFPYPKPLSLVQALIEQATDPNEGHIVLDFFAGSGTTGHAVLAQNYEDNGNRRFILVSSTEATDDEPDKNVCRDISIKRLRSAVDGYSWRTSRGVQQAEGLGGTVAYMTAHRIPMENLHLDIRHDQIWYTLQMIHTECIEPFSAERLFQLVESELSRLVYIPRLSDEVVSELEQVVLKDNKPTVVYTWQPGVLEQRLRNQHVSVEKIPEYLIERFGGDDRR